MVALSCPVLFSRTYLLPSPPPGGRKGLGMNRLKRNRRKRNQLVLQNLEPRQLLAVDGFAPIDGVGNNLDQPNWGAVDEQFIRLSPAAFEDGIGAPARSDQMNAREISNLIAAQEGSVENDRFITSMWFQWGQFLDHDIARVFDVAPFEELTPRESLDIDENFPFHRSPYDPDTGVTTPRQYVNHVTAFIDASVVYGSDASHAASLRTFEGGKLKSQETTVGELLPLNTDGLINEPSPSPNFFLAGDVRSNENIGLTSMQTLWVREHNRIATELAAGEFAGQDLSDADVDEEIYQRARQIVMGLVQNITYNEFLPSTLGFNAIETYQGYDSTIDPQISDEFAAAAYRIGHTTLTDELLIAGGEAIPLAEAFFRPDIVNAMGIDSILEGLTLQTMQEVDHQIVDAVRNFLDDGPGFDLAAINIQRGRDQGLPDYNTLRESIGLERLQDFDEMTSNEALADLFELVYETPDNADPWLAMISEDHLPGTMTGETIYTIMVDQFARLRDGDRFYFENAIADQDLVDEIKATRLSDVIRRNTTAEVQDEVFWTRDTLVFRNGLDNEWLIRDFGDNGGAEVVFFGEPGIRDPNNREETIPVQRDEPINAVIVAGINELGDGFFIPNALVSSPLADEGIDEFIITADIDFFEGYGLGGNDRWVFESDIASVFASGDAGSDQLHSEANVQSGEVALTGGAGRDSISMDAPEAEMVFADGGEGRDHISVHADQADRVIVEGGSGRDRITVRADRADQVIVLGEEGRDSVNVRAIGAGSVFVDGGTENDRLWVAARDAAVVEVLGQEGRDHLLVITSRDIDTHVDGGPGRDRVQVIPRSQRDSSRGPDHRRGDSPGDRSLDWLVDRNEMSRQTDRLFADLGRR